MSTDLTRTSGGNLTDEQVALVKRTICKGATDDELSMFVQTAQRLGLDPFARQVFAVKRWDSREGREVMSIQVSIDGFRLVAERTGKYAGQLGPLWTADGKEWLEVWLDSAPPKAAKVGVLRHDFKEPVWSVATWAEYKQEGKNGLSPMWKRMGALMLAKCAESLALRRAFPNELSGAYSDAEMAQVTPATDVEVTDAGPKGATGAMDHSGTGSSGSETGKSVGTPSESTQVRMPTTSDGTATSRPPRANTIKHDGTFANAPAVKLLHVLKGKVGGMTEDAYRKQLAAFKDCDGNPIKTSTELSEAQIDNLIDRYKKKIHEQEKRAAEDLDTGAIFPTTLELADLRGKLIDQDFVEAEWTQDLFGVDNLAALTKAQAATALQLVMARAKGPDEYGLALDHALEAHLIQEVTP